MMQGFHKVAESYRRDLDKLAGWFDLAFTERRGYMILQKIGIFNISSKDILHENMIHRVTIERVCVLIQFQK